MKDIKIGDYTISKNPNSGNIELWEDTHPIMFSYEDVTFESEGKRYIVLNNQYYFGKPGITICKEFLTTDED